MAETNNQLTGMLPIHAFIEQRVALMLGQNSPVLMERIFSISREMIANPSLDDILHSIVQAAAELAACEMAGILLSDASASRLNFVAVTNFTDRLFDLPVPIDQSIAGAAFTGNRPVIVQDVKSDARYYAKVDELLSTPAKSILAVPLTFRDYKIGVIEVVNKTQGPFNEADVRVLVGLAAQATITLEMTRLYRQSQAEIAERIKVEAALRHHQEHLEELVKERTAEAQRLAVTDLLTGLFNRGHLMTLGDQAVRRARGERQPFSALMVDIDHFKKINETYGHAVGDSLLRKLAGIFQKSLRAADLAGRYDGEEFAVLMPNTGLQAACELAERLLDQIRAAQVETARGPIGFTASIGVVEMDQAGHQTLDSLIDLADQATRAAKQAGRNQIFVGNLLAEVQRLALTDSLTGLYNRGYWMLLGKQAMQEARRAGQPFSAIMFDGDHFKSINDTYGHAKGDEMAKELAGLLRRHVRSTDIIGRYGGGDEYLVLMPNTNLQSAHRLAERLLDEIRAARIDTVSGQVGITASVGVAEMDPDQPQTLEDLINLADQASYTAKRAGGNRVYIG